MELLPPLAPASRHPPTFLPGTGVRGRGIGKVRGGGGGGRRTTGGPGVGGARAGIAAAPVAAARFTVAAAPAVGFVTVGTGRAAPGAGAATALLVILHCIGIHLRIANSSSGRGEGEFAQETDQQLGITQLTFANLAFRIAGDLFFFFAAAAVPRVFFGAAAFRVLPTEVLFAAPFGLQLSHIQSPRGTLCTSTHLKKHSQSPSKAISYDREKGKNTISGSRSIDRPQMEAQLADIADE